MNHLAWKLQLQELIKSGEKVDRNQCTSDNECNFGRWIYAEGLAKYGQMPMFADLRTKHAAFHREIGEILKLVEAGKKQEAIDSLNGDAYLKCSDDLIAAVIKLKSA